MSWGRRVLGFGLGERRGPTAWCVWGVSKPLGAEAQTPFLEPAPRVQQPPVASWTLSRHLWKSAPCPTHGRDAGRGHTPSFLLSCPSQAPEPGPARRPRFALGLSLQWETLRSAGEEGDSCPASLPTQQLRPPGRAGEGTQPPFQVPPFLPRGPRLSFLLPGQRSPFFLCRFIPQEGSFSQSPVKAALFRASLGPGSRSSLLSGKTWHL